MFGFFKKATPEKPEPERNGFFSTDWAFSSRKIDISRHLSKSFQVDPFKLKPVNQEGFAMDMLDFDADTSNLQSVKLMNGGQYEQLIPAQQLMWFAGQGFIGYQTCAMIAQNWLVDKACSMPALDAVRNGYEITVNDGSEIEPEIFDEIKRIDKEMNINAQLVDFERFKRIFGIRMAMFKVDSNDPDYYTKPFNPDGVTAGSYRGIVQIDPYWLTPELDQEGATNPASDNFYNPAWWRVNGKRVHRSHLVVARNGKLADILKPSYLYGGIPVPQKIAERVYAAEKTANEAPMLAMTKRLTTLKTDTQKASANYEQFVENIGKWTSLMNNYGVKVIGLDDEIQQFDTALAEVDTVIMTQYQLVAAASEVPATKLLGTSPKGFGASGEYEETSYHEMLSSLQTADLTPFLERHHLLLIRSEIAPKYGIKPFNTAISWNPINELSSQELADINLKKAQTAAIYTDAGAIDGMDIREVLQSDKESGFNGLEDRKIELSDASEDIND